jgi:hypothetical protein
LGIYELWSTLIFQLYSSCQVVGGDVSRLFCCIPEGTMALYHSYSKGVKNAALVSKATVVTKVIVVIM